MAARGGFTQQLELHSQAEIDDDVRGWLKDAWEQAAWKRQARHAEEER